MIFNSGDLPSELREDSRAYNSLVKIIDNTFFESYLDLMHLVSIFYPESPLYKYIVEKMLPFLKEHELISDDNYETFKNVLIDCPEMNKLSEEEYDTFRELAKQNFAKEIYGIDSENNDIKKLIADLMDKRYGHVRTIRIPCKIGYKIGSAGNEIQSIFQLMGWGNKRIEIYDKEDKEYHYIKRPFMDAVSAGSVLETAMILGIIAISEDRYYYMTSFGEYLINLFMICMHADLWKIEAEKKTLYTILLDQIITLMLRLPMFNYLMKCLRNSYEYKTLFDIVSGYGPKDELTFADVKKETILSYINESNPLRRGQSENRDLTFTNRDKRAYFNKSSQFLQIAIDFLVATGVIETETIKEPIDKKKKRYISLTGYRLSEVGYRYSVLDLTQFTNVSRDVFFANDNHRYIHIRRQQLIYAYSKGIKNVDNLVKYFNDIGMPESEELIKYELNSVKTLGYNLDNIKVVGKPSIVLQKPDHVERRDNLKINFKDNNKNAIAMLDLIYDRKNYMSQRRMLDRIMVVTLYDVLDASTIGEIHLNWATRVSRSLTSRTFMRYTFELALLHNKQPNGKYGSVLFYSVRGLYSDEEPTYSAGTIKLATNINKFEWSDLIDKEHEVKTRCVFMVKGKNQETQNKVKELQEETGIDIFLWTMEDLIAGINYGVENQGMIKTDIMECVLDKLVPVRRFV